MKKLFLFTSCRVHRPFNCEKKHINGKYDLYDCLNTNFGEKYSLGSLYESSYILQTLKSLIDKKIENKDNIQVYTSQKQVDTTQFLEICNALTKADIIIIEIATIKYFMNDSIYVSAEHCNDIGMKPTKVGKLNVKMLIDNITQIERLVHNIGKKVLFVSHFNNNNIPNRKLIIESLKTKVKYFFDPTYVITSNEKLKDPHHYKFSTEVEIMEEIHNHLSIL